MLQLMHLNLHVFDFESFSDSLFVCVEVSFVTDFIHDCSGKGSCFRVADGDETKLRRCVKWCSRFFSDRERHLVPTCSYELKTRLEERKRRTRTLLSAVHRKFVPCLSTYVTLDGEPDTDGGGAARLLSAACILLPHHSVALQSPRCSFNALKRSFLSKNSFKNAAFLLQPHRRICTGSLKL